MVKHIDPVEMEAEAAAAVVAVLNDVPALTVDDVVREAGIGDQGVDFRVDFAVAGVPHNLLVEVKSSGSPRSARYAINQLISYQSLEKSRHGNQADYALVFVAPYLSPQVRELCREYDVNYVDLYGNARLVLPGLYINREVAETPAAEKRDLKSLFKPKSARVLRFLLTPGQQPRRLSEIAEATRVSIGQVHKLKTALLERDWIEETPDGVVVRNADQLLDAWRLEYEPSGHRQGYYTPLHGGPLEEAVSRAVGNAGPHAALAGRSAASWHAPWLMAGPVELYADGEGAEVLVRAMDLEATPKGPNVWITVLDDDGALLDAIEVRKGLRATGLVQTYLDLYRGGERDREAADHLRAERLSW